VRATFDPIRRGGLLHKVQQLEAFSASRVKRMAVPANHFIPRLGNEIQGTRRHR